MITINGQKTSRLRLKEGEVKVFIFKYNVDIQNAQFTFGIKNNKDSQDYDIVIPDSAFDKTEIANKIVKCIVNTSPLKGGEIYFGEMKTVWMDGQNVLVDKTEDIVIEVMKAVTP